MTYAVRWTFLRRRSHGRHGRDDGRSAVGSCDSGCGYAVPSELKLQGSESASKRLDPRCTCRSRSRCNDWDALRQVSSYVQKRFCR